MTQFEKAIPGGHSTADEHLVGGLGKVAVRCRSIRTTRGSCNDATCPLRPCGPWVTIKPMGYRPWST